MQIQDKTVFQIGILIFLSVEIFGSEQHYLLWTNLLFRPDFWGEELYTQMGFFCSVNFGRSIHSS